MTHAFEIERLEKTFSEFKLGPIDLILEPGTVLGYVGPNGSGKTTTMQCMTGLIRAESGTVKIFGKENDPNNPEWKFDVGYAGDKRVFYENWSGEKNLNFQKQFYPDWDVQLEKELIKRFEIPIKKKAKRLSSGNRAKLSLIGALAHRPKLLILDEPTSGLDPVVRTEFLDVLFEVIESGERAIFYSTHILSDISRIADELAFLNNGVITLKTSKEDLTENWRRISFKLPQEISEFPAAVAVEREASNYRIISRNYQKTIDALKRLDAENIRAARMSIDEIAVQILKNKN
ncbi:MAG: ABC transporter ATP-binding protein [Chlorobi bacterium]|nr:ABC transporter ATP-binding protein [Chlorobiota bacterium]